MIMGFLTARGTVLHLLLISSCIAASLPSQTRLWGAATTAPLSKASTSFPRGGGDTSAENEDDSSSEEAERRWESLMTYCAGNWSGSIAWYDGQYENKDNAAVCVLVPRPENHELNMRLSFLPAEDDDPNVANWVVYHARAQGLREEVFLEKYPSRAEKNSKLDKLQTFYCFDGGIVGRTGNDYGVLPVIEHGFWADGVRRTIVLVYDKKMRRLEKICFLQQRRTNKEDFDVAGSDPADRRVLPQTPAQTLDQLASSWDNCRIITKAESISLGGTRITENTDEMGDTLDRLLGTKKEEQVDEMLHVALPNGVVLACPWRFPDKERFEILMGCETKSGQVQVVEFVLEKASFQKVTATWWERPSWIQSFLSVLD